MGKGNLIDIPRENQSRPENKSGSANNIIPGASLSRAFNTPPPPLQSGKSISLAIGGIGDGKYNERFHSKAHFGADCIIPGSSTPPSFEASLQKTDAIVSDQASPKGKVKISGTKGNGVVSGLKFRKRQSQSHLCKRFYLLKLLSRKNDSRIYPSHALNQRVRPFLVIFATNASPQDKQGLLVHFGKQDKALPLQAQARQADLSQSLRIRGKAGPAKKKPFVIFNNIIIIQ